MTALPQPTIDAIYEAYKRRDDGRMSSRLGASQLGESCNRRLWYGFRHVHREEHEGRMLRLFQTGHREEARIIDDLRAAGIVVYDKDPSTGQQYEYTGLGGHLVCKVDGVVTGLPESPETPHLLEVKSSNKKNFDKIEKDGVAKAKPVHYAQMQVGMGLAELTRAVYIVACKDDDRLYVERVKFDDKAFKALLMRARHVIDAESPPERVSQDPDNFVCRFCPFAKLCHGDAMPLVNCRTCVHASAAPSGKWACANGHPMQPGCGEHVYIPDLLHWAEPIDGDPTWVKYRVKSTGREFINCADTGFPADDAPHYASRELANCTPAALGHEQVEKARSILAGKIAESWSLAE
jgi:CRISPR/Cas system-associated exonuclease Cas4 (RecB family)